MTSIQSKNSALTPGSEQALQNIRTAWDTTGQTVLQTNISHSRLWQRHREHWFKSSFTVLNSQMLWSSPMTRSLPGKINTKGPRVYLFISWFHLFVHHISTAIKCQACLKTRKHFVTSGGPPAFSLFSGCRHTWPHSSPLSSPSSGPLTNTWHSPTVLGSGLGVRWRQETSESWSQRPARSARS